MNRVLVCLASSLLACQTASAAQPFEGRWRTASTDPDICMKISAAEFIDPLSEISCRVTRTQKTGRNTWTLSALCTDSEQQQLEAIYLRLLSPNRLRVRQGSAGPLMVLQRC